MQMIRTIVELKNGQLIMVCSYVSSLTVHFVEPVSRKGQSLRIELKDEEDAWWEHIHQGYDEQNMLTNHLKLIEALLKEGKSQDREHIVQILKKILP
jgi:hypothetical protein